MPATAKPTGYTAGAATLRPHHLWMFDEGAGTSLVDKGSTGGKDLTIVGADWNVAEATHGTSLSFVEANSDYAHRTDTGSEPIMGITTSFTVAVLLKTTEATKDMVGICDASGLDAYFMGGSDSTPEMRWSVRDDGTVNTAGDIVGATLDTSWHWCVWTFGNNAQTGSYDGTLYGSAAMTGNVALAANQALMDRFCIGGRISSSPAYADIEVAAAAVWVNTILDETQQLDLWNSGDVWTAMGVVVATGQPAHSRRRGVSGMNTIASRFGRGW